MDCGGLRVLFGPGGRRLSGERETMARRGGITPLVPKVPSLGDVRPSGEPLRVLLGLHAEHRLPQVKYSTRASYRETYALLGGLGDHPSVGEVGAWVTWLRRRYPPPVGYDDSWTVHLHWHNLAALYAWAKEWGFASGVNPAAVLKLPKPRPRARPIPDLGHLWTALLTACRDDRERALLTVARHTGARRGELLGLMPSDLVTVVEPWRLRFERQRRASTWETGPLKGHEHGRSLPVVAPELREALVRTIEAGAPLVWKGRGRQKLMPSPFLFPYANDHLVELRRRLGAVAPAAFGPGDFLHRLRHTLAVDMNRAGASDEEVQHQLGHDDVVTTRYTYLERFARPVDAAPLRRLARASRKGATAWGAPPGEGTAPPRGSAAGRRSGARPVAAGRAPRPTGAVQPKNEKEASCRPRVERGAGVQRGLPGLSVGPVVRRRKR